MLSALREAGFDVATRNHAEAILRHDFPAETAELIETLSGFNIATEELIRGGGGESGQTRRLRRALSQLGWQKHNFVVRTIVDGAAAGADLATCRDSWLRSDNARPKSVAVWPAWPPP